MNFELTTRQKRILEETRAFSRNILLPGVIERDEKAEFPAELVLKIAAAGYFGMMTSQDYQGLGMDTVSYVLALEEIAKVDAVAAVMVSVNNSLACWSLENFGTPAQKNEWLTKLASGNIIGAFCLSEPQSGSDLANLKTVARQVELDFIIDGEKKWITNGSKAGLYIVFCLTDRMGGKNSLSSFLVNSLSPGITKGPLENKMGIRASDTCTIKFESVKVKQEHLLGELGQGYSLAMKMLNVGRLGIAAQALGIASGAFELSRDYALNRHAFGVPIAKHQSIQFKLAEMATRIETARLLCLKAAWLKDQQKDFSLASSMAKLYASETAVFVTQEAVQIHGGNGYIREYQVERMMRDAKITQIYEGTSEIQKLVIGKKILD
jgi:alkylation response protein AidB-like acyl-CoA dehydrogenase